MACQPRRRRGRVLPCAGQHVLRDGTGTGPKSRGCRGRAAEHGHKGSRLDRRAPALARHDPAPLATLTVVPLCYRQCVAVRKKRSISIPPELDAEIAAAAEAAGMSYSAWVAQTA